MSGWHGVKPTLCGSLVVDSRGFLVADTIPASPCVGSVGVGRRGNQYDLWHLLSHGIPNYCTWP